MKMDLDQLFIADNEKLIALKVFGNIVADLKVIQIGSLDQQLGIKLVLLKLLNFVQFTLGQIAHGFLSFPSLLCYPQAQITDYSSSDTVIPAETFVLYQGSGQRSGGIVFFLYFCCFLRTFPI